MKSQTIGIQNCVIPVISHVSLVQSSSYADIHSSKMSNRSVPSFQQISLPHESSPAHPSYGVLLPTFLSMASLPHLISILRTSFTHISFLPSSPISRPHSRYPKIPPQDSNQITADTHNNATYHKAEKTENQRSTLQ